MGSLLIAGWRISPDTMFGAVIAHFFGMDFPKESQRNGQISGNALSTH